MLRGSWILAHGWSAFYKAGGGARRGKERAEAVAGGGSLPVDVAAVDLGDRLWVAGIGLRPAGLDPIVLWEREDRDRLPGAHLLADVQPRDGSDVLGDVDPVALGELVAM